MSPSRLPSQHIRDGCNNTKRSRHCFNIEMCLSISGILDVSDKESLILKVMERECTELGPEHNWQDVCAKFGFQDTKARDQGPEKNGFFLHTGSCDIYSSLNVYEETSKILRDLLSPKRGNCVSEIYSKLCHGIKGTILSCW